MHIRLESLINCAADKAIDTDHTVVTDCNCQLKNNNINDVIYYLLVQVLICTYAT